MFELKNLKCNEAGLIPAVIQEWHTRQVLMVAYMNQEALRKTLETKETWFWSRSRQALWHKGETSGNTQQVKAVAYDCDGDTLLVSVVQRGNACHTGAYSCFFNSLYGDVKGINSDVLFTLYRIISHRKENPKEGSYTNYLFDKGIDKILKKVGEEAAEVIIGAKNPDKKELIYETADLLYHLLVLLNERDVALQEVLLELENRHKKEK